METIINIIKGIKPGVAIDENTRLLDDKILDSLAMVALVAELVDEFDVDIKATDVIPENFGSVKDINALIERLEDED